MPLPAWGTRTARAATSGLHHERLRSPSAGAPAASMQHLQQAQDVRRSDSEREHPQPLHTLCAKFWQTPVSRCATLCLSCDVLDRVAGAPAQARSHPRTRLRPHHASEPAYPPPPRRTAIRYYWQHALPSARRARARVRVWACARATERAVNRFIAAVRVNTTVGVPRSTN